MTTEVVETITCRCGHVVQQRVLVITELGKDKQVSYPMQAALFERFECPQCGSHEVVQSRLG